MSNQEDKTHRVSFSCSKKMWERLKAAAEHEGVGTPTGWAKKVVFDQLEETEKRMRKLDPHPHTLFRYIGEKPPKDKY